MSKASRGTPITLSDGRQRLMRYSNGALMDLEDRTGMTVVEHMERVKKGSMNSIAALVWAGLVDSEPQLTIRDVANLINLRESKNIGTAIGVAIKEAFGDDEDEEAAEDAEGKASAAS